MINVIKQSFNYTNKYIILATPLILFSLISSLYVMFSVNGSIINAIIALFLFFLMISAFLSGWFYMISNVVKEEEDEPNSLLKIFPAGVGEYMLPVIGMIFNILLISFAFIAISYFVGMKFIGSTGISPEAFAKALESTALLKAFVASLTEEQLIKLNCWNLLILFTLAFMYFMVVFYPPVLFLKTKNPFRALFICVKDLFCRNFFKNILMYLILFVSYFTISLLANLSAVNPILYFIFTLINFYYLVLAGIFVFNYYYLNYIKIGSNIDTTV